MEHLSLFFCSKNSSRSLKMAKDCKKRKGLLDRGGKTARLLNMERGAHMPRLIEIIYDKKGEKVKWTGGMPRLFEIRAL